jgi:hypothetical protein
MLQEGPLIRESAAINWLLYIKSVLSEHDLFTDPVTTEYIHFSLSKDHPVLIFRTIWVFLIILFPLKSTSRF